MSAVPSAVAPAVDSAVEQANLLNVATGYPAPQLWPGAIDPSQYSGTAGETSKQQAVPGAPPANQFAADVPGEPPSSGGYSDTSWLTGTDAPQAPWDSLAGAPFAGSGAIAQADTHGADTGSVFQHEHVVPPNIGKLTRHTGTGQTWNRTWAFEPVNGQQVSVPNDRRNLDQQQRADSDAYDPYWVPYAERPIYQNLAQEAGPYAGQGIYAPSGAVPDMSVYDYAGAAYTEPPDPSLAAVQAPAGAAAGGDGYDWVVG